MKPALAQVCSLPSPFEADIEEYAAGQCRAVDVWLTKLEQYLVDHSAADVQALLAEHQVELPVASFQGGLLSSQGAARQEAWDLFDRRLDLCRAIGIGTIVIACDVSLPLGRQDVDRVRISLSAVARRAAQFDVRAALEFQAAAGLGNNLQTAAALVEQASSPHLGLCLDAYHYFVGPSKSEDLGYLDRDNLFHVQLCDLVDTPRELASDSERILPGEGDIFLQPILQRLREIRYDGYVAVELMNPQVWQVPPRQFGEIAMTALRKLLDQASHED